ncbi:MAG: tRNA 2-thiouridine synthesizing protein A [Pseudohongiellaceae bacterium]|jgi:tRNA 2-thiouridine synthesizing protein A
MINITVDIVLDTSGLICPEPVMLLHKTVRELTIGQVIEVIATDPATTRDVPSFCEFLGHELISQINSNDSSYRYLIKKSH